MNRTRQHQAPDPATFAEFMRAFKEPRLPEPLPAKLPGEDAKAEREVNEPVRQLTAVLN